MAVMKYRNLFLMVLLISLVFLASVNSQAKPRRTRPLQRKPKKAPYSSTSKVDLDLCYDFSVSEKTSKIELLVVLPKTIPYRQRIHSIKYSIEPSRVFSENGNDYAEFVFLNPEKRFKLEVNIKARLFRYDLSIARKKHKANSPKDPNLNDFLKQEQYIEKDHRQIQQIAKGIKGRTQAVLVKNIHDYVINNMEYYNDRKSSGAAYAAKEKKGECIEYADLFVAICRAKNLPARVIQGYTIESRLTPRHAWAEVYLRRYGWVPFDPTWGDISYKSAKQFHYLKSVYLYLTPIRNDEVINNRYYYSYKYWGGAVRLNNSLNFK